MKLVREKSMRAIFDSFVVSPDGSRLALWCSKKVTVFSLPELNKLEEIPVPLPEGVCFLSDSRSLFIKNERGVLRLWQNGVLTGLKGKVPGYLQGTCIHGETGDSFFFSDKDEVWRYDLATQNATRIFETKQILHICGITGGSLRIALYPTGDAVMNALHLVELSSDGTVLRKARTKSKLYTPSFHWMSTCDNEGYFYFISHAPMPTEDPPLPPVPRYISYSFGPDGKATVLNEADQDDYYERLHKRKQLTDGRIAMYRVAPDGSMLKKKFESTDYARIGTLSCGNGILSRCHDGDHGISFFDSKTLDLLYRLKEVDYTSPGSENYPQRIHFCKDGRIILSTIYSLILFRIQE